jgi:hypothetical protein
MMHWQYARDELGISKRVRQGHSSADFCGDICRWRCFAFLIVLFAPDTDLIVLVSAASLLFLTLLGMLAAYSGGAGIIKGAFRVAFWGALAMGLTAAVGSVFGTVVKYHELASLYYSLYG